MGHRHRWRADRCLAIDLGVVALVDLGIVTAQPDSADRESAITAALRDAGFLQQRKRAAPRADEDEFGFHRSLLSALKILNLHPPAPILLANDIGDAVLVMYLATGMTH